jgi:PEP-CTERM motif
MTRYFSTISALLFMSLLVLPTNARADFMYSFSSTAGSFSFTETSLLTTSQGISINPFTLDGVSFTNASLNVVGMGDCFLFGTSNVSFDDCHGDVPSGNFSWFSALFVNATAVGTYTSGAFGCGSGGGDPCIFPIPAGWSLEILQTSAVPEPSSLMLLGSGALGLIGPVRRKLLHPQSQKRTPEPS